MERGQQIAALRSGLREKFPLGHPAAWGSDAQGPPKSHSTGLRTLDQVLGGGLPFGRISEVTGKPSSGKTTLTFQIIAQATRAGLPVAYIDPTRAFFPPSASAAGVDLERLLLIRTSSIVNAMKAADILLRGGAFSLVVFDWAADPPTKLVSAALGSFIARLNGLCALSETTLLFITTPRTARDPVRYYACLRVEVRRDLRLQQTWRAASAHATAVREEPAPCVTPHDTQPRDTLAGETPARRLRLVGIPCHSADNHLSVFVVKNKVGLPGGQAEVSLDERSASWLPLHSGIPDSGPPAR